MAELVDGLVNRGLIDASFAGQWARGVSLALPLGVGQFGQIRIGTIQGSFPASLPGDGFSRLSAFPIRVDQSWRAGRWARASSWRRTGGCQSSQQLGGLPNGYG